jgi:hypothetical protein
MLLPLFGFRLCRSYPAKGVRGKGASLLHRDKPVSARALAKARATLLLLFLKYANPARAARTPPEH